MNFRRSGQEDVGFQMAPMIDIIFVLLLFFIITSAIQQNEKDITIALPSTKSGEPTDQGRSEIIINVAANGDLIIHNEKLSLEVLREKLEQLATSRRATGALLKFWTSVPMQICATYPSSQ